MWQFLLPSACPIAKISRVITILGDYYLGKGVRVITIQAREWG